MIVCVGFRVYVRLLNICKDVDYARMELILLDAFF